MKKLLLLLACCLLTSAAAAFEDKTAPKRLLVITESRGFVHDVVRRPKDGSFCLVEQILTELGKANGFEVVCSQDSRKEINAENLKQFDAVFFYTTGSLPLSDTQKADLISFVRNGKGFTGAHSATDTFYDWPEYGKLIGGYFDQHPWHQKVKVVVEDTQHPATRHLGKSFEITDEIYQFKTPYSRENLRVLMRLDFSVDRERIVVNGKEVTGNVEFTFKDGEATLKVNGKDVRPRELRFEGRKGHRPDRDHALAWIQEYGKGRVFYTALGHRPEVWKDERFQKHLVGGLRYAMGLENADATPSARTR